MRNLFISLVMLTVLGLAGTGLAAEPILVGTTTSTGRHRPARLSQAPKIP